jgi:hypothetical protein
VGWTLNPADRHDRQRGSRSPSRATGPAGPIFGGRHAGHCHAHCCAHICPSCAQLPSHPSQ